MIIRLLVEGGNMKPSPAISQKLGPLGINIGKIIGEVNKATQQYAGLKVGVELDINTVTKEFKVNVLTPPTSELLKKELKVNKASMMSGSVYVGNLAIETCINIAKKKIDAIGANELKKALLSVVSTCLSCGILVESKNAKEVIEEINNGVYDELIKNAKEKDLVVNDEKKHALETAWKKVEANQEKLVKEILKKREEKKAATAGAPTSSTTTTTTISKTTSKSEGKS